MPNATVLSLLSVIKWANSEQALSSLCFIALKELIIVGTTTTIESGHTYSVL